MNDNKRNHRPSRRRRPSGWDGVADWYDGWVGKGGSIHHRKLAIPSLLALLAAQKGERVLDIGAGQGVLAPDIARAGAAYVGVDVSARLLAYARQHHGAHGEFIEADAAHLSQSPALQAASFDAVTFLLSIQDMDPLDDVLQSAAWALKSGGRAVLLMTHPAFRVPRQSGWGFDEGRKLQYRRVDRYLTPLPVPMKQHPGKQSGVTISFHRAISDYVNGLAAHNLLIDRMEEIPLGDHSLNKKRGKAEKLADAEIPLFMALRARKISA
ncbi:MAG: class I SAM-dependent methyltransferase [Anaerolineaceae bacterium]|nr:MAG: class I SAM-dependent methyltransferase [Anaerolineaceae bacterium]